MHNTLTFRRLLPHLPPRMDNGLFLPWSFFWRLVACAQGGLSLPHILALTNHYRIGRGHSENFAIIQDNHNNFKPCLLGGRKKRGIRLRYGHWCLLYAGGILELKEGGVLGHRLRAGV